MAAARGSPSQRPKGYPRQDKVLRGCGYVAQAQPDDVFITCAAKIHNLSERRKAAVLQVFKINTLAACWMLRDITEHNPEKRFAAYRKHNSTHYRTDAIAARIEADYRERVRSRYTLNTYLFNGLCTSLASMISGYLQRVAAARKKGVYQKFQVRSVHSAQCARTRFGD